MIAIIETTYATTIPSSADIAVLIIGLVVAYVVSMIAIKFLVDYVKKHDFKAFGVYRIVLGIIVVAYFGLRILLGA